MDLGIPLEPKIEEGTIMSSKTSKNVNLKRVYSVRKEPKFVRFQQNFWPSQTYYYLYIILLGNGVDGIPMTYRFALDISGGLYILQLIVVNFILFLPIMYMEIFLGKYTHMANSQMYRMAPIFFGFCVLTFILSYLYCPITATDISIFILAGVKLMTNLRFDKCRPGHPICFDLRNASKANANCTNDYIGFRCGNTTGRYVAAYVYWKSFKEIDGHYSIWSHLISNVLTWIAIITLFLMGMKVLGILLRITFALNFVIYTVILIMALGTPGSSKGLHNMLEFRFDSFNMSYEIPIIAFFVTLRMGLITPSGFMTYAALTNHKTILSPGTECIALSMTNILLNIYYLVVMHSVSGALGALLHLEPKLTYVPFTGLYYALIPQFLVFKKNPIIFVFLYHLSNWILEVTKLSISLHMLIMNLYDFFPALTSYKGYVKMVIGIACTPLIIIMPAETFAKIYMPIFTMITIYFLHGFLLVVESLLVFYCYGVSRLNDDIHFVIGRRPLRLWRIMWYCYPIIICVGLFLVILAYQQERIDKLPLKNDTPNLPIFEKLNIIGLGIAIIYLFIMFVGTFFFIVVGIRSSTTIMDILKPQFHWGPQDKESRAARKAFTPRTSVKSQPPMDIKQRFRPRSIKQMHERDIAEHVTRGRVLMDFMFFSNVGNNIRRISGKFKRTDK